MNELSRDSISTARALKNLRDRGQAVWTNRKPWHKSVMDRMVESGWAVILDGSNDRKIMRITDAGREALKRYEDAYDR